MMRRGSVLFRYVCCIVACVCMVMTPGVAHDPLTSWSQCPADPNTNAGRFAPLPVFAHNTVGSPVTEWPAVGTYDFCAYMDTLYCQQKIFTGLITDMAGCITSTASLMRCYDADINGEPDVLGSPPVNPNGIPDGQYELGVLAAVLNDPSHPLHLDAHAAFQANFVLFKNHIQLFLGSQGYLGILGLFAKWYLGSLSMVLAGYATLGDATTYDALDALLEASVSLQGVCLLSEPIPGGTGVMSAPIPESGPEGDIDGNSFTNRSEYDILVGMLGYTAAQFAVGVLDPAQPGLVVVPTGDFASTGYPGGPFIPVSQVYTAFNPFDVALSWTAGTTESWLTVTPGSGTLNPSASVEITVSLNTHATTLEPGVYTDVVSIVPDMYAVCTRNVVLVIPQPVGELAVADSIPPTDDYNLPFGDTIITLTYTGQVVITNADDSFPLTIDNVALDSALYGLGASGFTLANLPALPMALGPGGGFTFDVVFDALGEGLHEDVIVIQSNDILAPEMTVSLSAVAAYDSLRVTPEAGFTAQGQEGGPFVPAENTYTITNDGAAPITWSATAPEWLAVTPDSGTLGAGLSQELTVSVNVVADGYASGHYGGTLVITNDITGITTHRNVALVVVAAMGNAAVTDSIAPVDDRRMPFGEVFVGAERREVIAVHNTDLANELTVEAISLDSMLYAEDFDDGTADGWAPLDASHWSVDSGQYRAAAPSYNGFMQSLYMGDVYGDAVFEATVQQNTSGYSMLLVRASDDFVFGALGLGFGVLFSGTTNEYITFRQYEWGPDISPLVSPHIFTDGTPNHVRIKMFGGTFFIYFNGHPAQTFTYWDAPASGRIGLGGNTTPTNQAIYHFDDIKVYHETPFRLEGVPVLPRTLAPGEFLAVDTLFAPGTRGLHQDVARIVTNNVYEPEVEVVLTGTGVGHRRYVRMDGDDGNDGLSWTSAKATLQAALELADVGDDIWVAAGTYYPTSLNDLDLSYGERGRHFRLKDGVYLYGGFNGTETTLKQRDWAANVTRLSGDTGEPGNPDDNCYHVLYNPMTQFNEYPMRLDGFVISDGNANYNYYYDTGSGAGIYGRFSFLTVSNCTFENNNASRRGGGAYVEGDRVQFTTCTFSNNTLRHMYLSMRGGGLYLYGSNLSVIESRFIQNSIIQDDYGSDTEGIGGGLYVWGRNALIRGCLFQENEVLLIRDNSFAGGGGATVSGRNSCVEDCTFIGNVLNGPGSYGALGGGLAIEDMVATTINNCRFLSNRATGSYGYSGGGAVTIAPHSAAAITNSIFFDNQTSGYLGGGAILVYSEVYFGVQELPINVTNCSFSGNTIVNMYGGDISNFFNFEMSVTNSIFWGSSPNAIFGDNVSVTYSDVQGGFAGEGNIDVLPLFVNAAAGDFRLQPGSPCINTGDPAGTPPAPATDILGTLRPQDGRVDMGAYEYDDTPPTVDIVLLSPAQTGVDEIMFAVTFSEPVKPGLAASHLVVTGTLSGAISVSGNGASYVVTVALSDPDADGTVGIALPAASVSDPAGNPCPGGASAFCQVFNWHGLLVEPVGARLYAGDSHLLRAVPDCGAGDIHYQWKWEGESKSVQDGPETSEWLLTDLTPAMQGTYWCAITYDGVVYQTTPVTVEVAPPLEITVQPKGGVKEMDAGHVFTVEAAGGYEPLHYEWRKDGIPIPDAPDSPIYTISSLNADKAGEYTVVVRDSHTAEVHSSIARLSIVEQMPAGVAAAAGIALALLLTGVYAAGKKTKR